MCLLIWLVYWIFFDSCGLYLELSLLPLLSSRIDKISFYRCLQICNMLKSSSHHVSDKVRIEFYSALLLSTSEAKRKVILTELDNLLLSASVLAQDDSFFVLAFVKELLTVNTWFMILFALYKTVWFLIYIIKLKNLSLQLMLGHLHLSQNWIWLFCLCRILIYS